MGSGEEERVKLVHKTIVQRGKMFEAFRTGFFEPLKKEDLGTRVNLFKQMAQLSHRITPGRHAKDIMDESFDKLLCHIFCRQKLLRDLSGRQ